MGGARSMASFTAAPFECGARILKKGLGVNRVAPVLGLDLMTPLTNSVA